MELHKLFSNLFCLLGDIYGIAVIFLFYQQPNRARAINGRNGIRVPIAETGTGYQISHPNIVAVSIAAYHDFQYFLL